MLQHEQLYILLFSGLIASGIDGVQANTYMHVPFIAFLKKFYLKIYQASA